MTETAKRTLLVLSMPLLILAALIALAVWGRDAWNWLSDGFERRRAREGGGRR